MKIFEFILTLIEKKLFFYYPQCVCILNRRDKVFISHFLPPKFRYFASQTGPKGEPHENEFWQFSNAKMSLLNSYGSKSRWKNGLIGLVYMSHFWVTVLNLSEIVSFLQLIAYISKISKAVIAICVYAFESSRLAL